MDTEYKMLHYELLGQLTDGAEDELKANEDKLAEHDDKCSLLSVCIRRLADKVPVTKSIQESEWRMLNVKFNGIRRDSKRLTHCSRLWIPNRRRDADKCAWIMSPSRL